MSDASQDLLFGLLALQNGFITRSQLVAAFGTWTDDKSKSLDELLLEQGALSFQRRELLHALVEAHLEQHANDPQKSLAALSSIASVRQDLERISDGDLQQSLQVVSMGRSAADSQATLIQPATQDLQSRFRILRPHAKGGLGEVFIAEDGELSREVALKEIQLKHAFDANAQSRFVREAEITGGLEHPGIVPVYGLGTYADGRPFYAMKFIKGDSLKEAIARFHGKTAKAAGKQHAPHFQGTEFRQLLQRFIDVCQAMQYAHDRNVLHRDLKPGNIMIGQYGETLVVDWGLAKPLGENSSEQSETSGEKPLIPKSSHSGSRGSETLPGSAVGTPAYMSPEQAAGELNALGPATDVYSLGATLYDLLTGKPPFSGADVGEMLRNVQRGRFHSPRAVQVGIPKPLEAICLKAMNLSPLNRYPSPKAMAEDLEHFLADESILAAPDAAIDRVKRIARKHRGIMSTGVAAMILVTIISGFAYFREAGLRDDLKDTNNSLSSALRKETISKKQAIEAREDAEIAKSKAIQTAEEKSRLADMNQLLFFAQRAVLNNLGRDGGVAYASRVTSSFNNSTLERIDYDRDFGELFKSRGPVFSSDAFKSLTTIPFASRHFEAALMERTLEGTPLTLHGHVGEVTCIAISGSGHTIASGSTDSTVNLWDSRSGTLTATLRGHCGVVRGISFSPDGELLVSAGEDAKVKIWDVSGENVVVTLNGHSESVNAVSFSPNGKHIASGGSDNTVFFWDAQAETLIRKIVTRDAVTSLAFSPDSTQIAIGSQDNYLTLWNVETHDCQVFGGHQAPITSVAYSPDGLHIATGSQDKTVKLWSAKTGQLILTSDGVVSGIFDGLLRTGMPRRLWGHFSNPPDPRNSGYPTSQHQPQIASIAFSPDGRLIASAGSDRTVRFWPTKTVVESNRFYGHHGAVTSLAFSPDGRRIITGSVDATVKVWDLAVAEFENRDRFSEIKNVAFSPDGRSIASVSSAGEVVIWDAQSRRMRRMLSSPKAGVNTIAFSPSGGLLASGSADGAITLWNQESGAELLTNKLGKESIRDLDFSPDGGLLSVGFVDGTIEIWGVNERKSVRSLAGHSRAVNSVSFSKDGQFIASGGDDNIVKLWDVTSGSEVFSFRGHNGPVRSVSFSPDSQKVVSGSEDHLIKVWDIVTLSESATLRGHSQGVNVALYSDDGARIVSGSNDESIAVWYAHPGVLALMLYAHEGGVSSLAFSPDNHRIVSCGRSPSVRLWDSRVAISTMTLNSPGEDFDLENVGFVLDGKWILGRDSSGKQVLWDSMTGNLIEDAPIPKNISALSRSFENKRLISTGTDVRILQNNSDYDPWAESSIHRLAWAPIWSARDVEIADRELNPFAAHFHRKALSKVKNDAQ